MNDIPVHIYILRDPRTDQVRYVGQTAHPEVRRKTHTRPSALKKDTPRNRWIRELLDAGLLPEFVVVEVCTSDVSGEAEYRWMRHYQDAGEILFTLVQHREGARPMGKPPVPKDKHYVSRTFRMNAALLRELQATVPPGRRSAVVHEALRRELRRLKRKGRPDV